MRRRPTDHTCGGPGAATDCRGPGDSNSQPKPGDTYLVQLALKCALQTQSCDRMLAARTMEELFKKRSEH